MIKKETFMYDEDLDRLMIFNNKENEKVEDNYLFGDFVISLTKSGKVVGLEVIGISNILKDYDMDPRILDNIENVELKVIMRKGAIYMFFNIESKIDMKPVKQKIPLIMSLN